jgi:RNA polymerase sigma-70 factor (ECF subfamily)
MDAHELQGELERLHAACFGWALWCCNQQREEAEEVLQTAYIKVLEGRARFDAKSSFRTWLFGVVRNTAREYRRQSWLRATLAMNWLTLRPSQTPEPGPETAACNSESSRVLHNAVAQLPERQRQVLHLVFYQEMTVEESAQVLGIALGTARQHFERGKGRLREILSAKEYL